MSRGGISLRHDVEVITIHGKFAVTVHVDENGHLSSIGIESGATTLLTPHILRCIAEREDGP